MNALMAHVCVTGLGLVSALGTGVEATYAALMAGRSGRRRLEPASRALGLPLDGHPAALDPTSLPLARSALRYVTPALAMLLRAAGEALARARCDAHAWGRGGLGLAIGAHAGERPCDSELAALAHAADPLGGRAAAARYGAALRARSPLTALRAQPGMITGMLSQVLGAHGPCLTFVDEDAAGAHAVCHAAWAVADGWCPAWIAGGTFDLDDPWLLLERRHARHPLGSAAAVLLLESVDAARARGAEVLAELSVAETLVILRRGTRLRAALALPAGDVMAGGLAGRCLAAQLGDVRAAALPLAAALAAWDLREAPGRLSRVRPQVDVASAGRA